PFRLPATLPSVLRQGDKGPAVAWLAARLALSGKTTVPDTTVFDATMVERVRQLQRRFGIPDDGIVGPETLFALTSQDAAGPHLAQDVP
ncbi:MAG TPA: peptidoglycan-binding domain-containing protein, partial [Rhodanobacteraceae bacterium]|nr:peptidoglycan-binding domain-containing protein [Rhodanobacteraceae bacterium]